MTESDQSLTGRIASYHEDGTLYLVFGSISAVIALLVIPLVGLIAVFCGYKLYAQDHNTTVGLLLALFGVIALILPLVVFGVFGVEPAQA